jgi:hypothetical protein
MKNGSAILERIELLAQQLSISGESRKVQLEIVATLFEEVTRAITLLHIAVIKGTTDADPPIKEDLQAVQDQLKGLDDALKVLRGLTEEM